VIIASTASESKRGLTQHLPEKGGKLVKKAIT